MRPRALVTAPVRGPGLDLLESLADLVIDPWIDQYPLRIYSAEQLAERAVAEEANLLIVEADVCDGPVFDLDLLAVASCRGDPNNVNLTAATASRVPVLYAPGRNADAVAEMTVALLLAATRRIVVADREVRAGEIYRDGTIPYQRFRAWELAGRTAGLIGLGAVGRATKWRLEGLGMEVVAHDPFVEDATYSLDELLSVSDIVSLHVPATEATKNMIGADQFAAMKDGVVFINTARAALHDTDALVEALRVGKVAAAALDHFEGEFLATDHPLASLDNVVLTPHIGGATFDTEANHTMTVARDLEALLSGARPTHIANPEVLEGR
jgi:D-3-phosphoglycerate dehydrogenase